MDELGENCLTIHETTLSNTNKNYLFASFRVISWIALVFNAESNGMLAWCGTQLVWLSILLVAILAGSAGILLADGLHES